MSGNFIKKSRITILLYILLLVAVGEWLTKQRTTDWDDSLWVTIYPINGDQSDKTQRYIDSLDIENFTPIERFMNREVGNYSLAIENPVTFRLAPELKAHPPTPPRNGNVLKVMLWSLQMRYWAWSNDNYDAPKDIQIFVKYFDPETHNRLAHSLGLQKGLLGVVNAFSSKKYNAQNNFVIAHEMLHTLGATDKYDLSTNLPIYPIGYADPDRRPLYPQKKAEIMGGTIPIDEENSEMPRGLKHAIIGEETAMEIRLLSTSD